MSQRELRPRKRIVGPTVHPVRLDASRQHRDGRNHSHQGRVHSIQIKRPELPMADSCDEMRSFVHHGTLAGGNPPDQQNVQQEHANGNQPRAHFKPLRKPSLRDDENHSHRGNPR